MREVARGDIVFSFFDTRIAVLGIASGPDGGPRFDKGFLSFQSTGELIVSPVADHVSLKPMGIDATPK
jgi:hypothetical protein